MIRKTIIVQIALWISLFSSGQESSRFNCDSLFREIMEPKLIGDFFFNQFLSRGSQYFIDKWLEGTVLLSNNKEVKDKKLRYNGYIDRLIRVTDNFQQVKLDKESVIGFTLYDAAANRNYTFRKIKIREEFLPDPIEVYAQQLYQGNISLYARRQVKKTGTDQDPGNRYMIYKFEKRTTYFFCYAGEPSSGFRKINRRNVLNDFPDRKEQIKNLLRINKFRKINSEDDLIKIAELVSSSI